MVRFRRQFSLARLIGVTCAMAINFAWVSWPGCGILAVAIALPLFVSGLTLIEVIVIYSIIGVLAGLLTPVIATHHPIRKRAPIMTAPIPTVPSGSLPPLQEFDEPED
jgi:hypothetical protein